MRPRRKRARQPRSKEPAREELSAGGIVFKRTPRGVRVAFIMDPFGKWAFAKGHVEEGESMTDAALRETREEMGLGRLRIIAPLGHIDFWFRDRYRKEMHGALIHKYVHYFLMEAPPSAKGQPQKTEKIRRLIWVPVSHALKVSSYSDVRPMLGRVLKYFIAHGMMPARGPKPATHPTHHPHHGPTAPPPSA